jgi:hypothetical protein
MFGTRTAYTAYTCSKRQTGYRLETGRMERRQSIVLDRWTGRSLGIDQLGSRLSSREETASTDQMERRNEAVRY